MADKKPARSSRSKSRSRRHKGRASAPARNGRRCEARLEPRKTPRQARSAETVEAILEAGAELFADLGYARTTTNKIAARAGVSIGSLYQYFPGKDAVLARLLSVHHVQVQKVLEQTLQELSDPATDLARGLGTMMRRLVSLHERQPKLTRALGADVVEHSAVQMHGHAEGDGFHRRVVALFESRPEVRPGNRAAMAAVFNETASTLTRWLVHEAPEGVDAAAMEREAVRMLTRFLLDVP